MDPSATIYGGFIDENSAMAFAESLDAASANPPAADSGAMKGGPLEVTPIIVPS